MVTKLNFKNTTLLLLIILMTSCANEDSGIENDIKHNRKQFFFLIKN